MTTQLRIGKDCNGTVVGDIPFSDTTVKIHLSANVEQTIGVPENMDCVYIIPETGATVWVNLLGSAAGSVTESDILLENDTSLLLESGLALILEGTAVIGNGVIVPTGYKILYSLDNISEISFFCDTSISVSLMFYNKFPKNTFQTGGI